MDSIVKVPAPLVVDKSFKGGTLLAIGYLNWFYKSLPEKILIDPDDACTLFFLPIIGKLTEEMREHFLVGFYSLEQKKYLTKIKVKQLRKGLIYYEVSPEFRSMVTCSRVAKCTRGDLFKIFTQAPLKKDPYLNFRLYLYIHMLRARSTKLPMGLKNKFIFNGYVPIGNLMCPRMMKKALKSNAAKQRVKDFCKAGMLKVYKLGKAIGWENGKVSYLIYLPEDEVDLAKILHFLTQSKEKRQRLADEDYNPEHEVLFITDEGDEVVGYIEQETEEESM